VCFGYGAVTHSGRPFQSRSPTQQLGNSVTHGTEHCDQDCRTLRLSAPRLPFCRLPDQYFLTRRSLYSCSGPEARNGLSLARNGCSFRSLHSEVNVPGLLLRFQLAAFAARSALLLCYPIRLAPVWVASLLLARCSFRSLFDSPRLQPPLPFGAFASRRIKAFNWICCLSARLPNPPDFLSLPAAGFYC
jgi:hypothetical protein